MKNIIYATFILIPLCTFSQGDDSKVNLGLGFGLDYGGFGARLTGTPSKNFGVFGSVGYALAGVGYNVGVQGIFNAKGRVVPYITGMYGYNAALVVTGAIEEKKIYYGPSFGLGMKLVSKKNANFWNFELLVPIRDPAFQDKIDELKNMGAVVSAVIPVAISVGYHFGF